MWKHLKSMMSVRDKSMEFLESLPEDGIVSGKSFTLRNGIPVETDEVFQAWTSGDLEKMLQATENKTNLIDRHYLLLGIVTQTYKKRKEPGYGDLCERYARIHMQEFGEIKPALIKELDGMMPSVPTFQNLAILLTEQERFEEAIAVCNSAISHGVHDGTKSGFEGRITRVRKKMAEKK